MLLHNKQNTKAAFSASHVGVVKHQCNHMARPFVQ